jgi:hypothetical protein
MPDTIARMKTTASPNHNHKAISSMNRKFRYLCFGVTSALALSGCDMVGAAFSDNSGSRGAPAASASAQTNVAGAIKADAAVRAPQTSQCTGMRGQLMDADPVGRNVRDAPATTGRRLGAIPPPYLGTEGVAFPAVFDVIASRNGWLLVENAGFDEALVGPNAPRSFSGRGWISGRGVLVSVQASLGFARPDFQSPITFDARGSGGILGGGVEEMRVRGVSACSGNWVQLEWTSPDYRGVGTVGFDRSAVVSDNPLVLRAWHTGICNLQETSCDGVNGDGPYARLAP